MAHIFLSASPLLSWLDRTGGVEALRFPGVAHDDEVGLKRAMHAAHQSFSKLRLMGKVNFFTADRICIDLFGVHPVEVYGPEWFEVDDPACAILHAPAMGVAA